MIITKIWLGKHLAARLIRKLYLCVTFGVQSHSAPDALHVGDMLSLSTVGIHLSRQDSKRREEQHIPRQPVDTDSLGITNGVGVLQHSVTSVTAWAPHGL